MNWFDVLMIVFSVTAANHLGLVAAAESVVRHRLPILNCPKCAAFWSVIVYGVAVEMYSSLFTPFPTDGRLPVAFHSSLHILAAAFLSAWSAVWLDLLMGIIDQLYIKVYDKIYSTADTPDTDATGG